MKILILLFLVCYTFAQNVNEQGNVSGMILVKSDTFTMGNNDGKRNEKPEHKVKLDSYYIGKELYSEDNGCNTFNWVTAVLKCNELSKIHGFDTVYKYSEYKHEDRIIKVKHQGEGKSQSYTTNKQIYFHELVNLNIDLAKNGFRMPTEAEWEYAVKKEIIDINNRNPISCKKTNEVYEFCIDYMDSKYYKTSPSENPVNLERKDNNKILNKIGGEGRPKRVIRGYKNSKTKRLQTDGEYTTSRGEYSCDFKPAFNRYFLRLVRKAN